MPQPQLALVLGSGGVRSVAALGIAEVLGEAGYAPDLVAGCSSGALFGACIAMGWTGREGLDAATRLWTAELTEQKRWRAWLELLAPRWAGFDADFSLRDARLIRERIDAAFGDARLEDLPIPLRIATTVASTGAPFMLDHGRVADAVRASMALPFLFPSVEWQGRRLTDGVLTNPLPVSLATEARVVLTVGFRGALPRRVNRASRLVAQVTTTMINNLQRAQVCAAEAAGARLLHFELDIDRRIGLWETAAMPRLYEIGRQAAYARLPEIRRLFNGDSPRLLAKGDSQEGRIDGHAISIAGGRRVGRDVRESGLRG
ncbi:MAG TPA: patatin-like phospholipase family protein [Steroidobacteraceae bacterium]|nr:patatin-like phospholipase family protein [Steroidobacteraceae bacterium]